MTPTYLVHRISTRTRMTGRAFRGKYLRTFGRCTTTRVRRPHNLDRLTRPEQCRAPYQGRSIRRAGREEHLTLEIPSKGTERWTLATLRPFPSPTWFSRFRKPIHRRRVQTPQISHSTLYHMPLNALRRWPQCRLTSPQLSSNVWTAPTTNITPFRLLLLDHSTQRVRCKRHKERATLAQGCLYLINMTRRNLALVPTP